MTKPHSERILKAARALGIPTTITSAGNYQYEVRFFSHSEMVFKNYQAARLVLIAHEIEKGVTL